MGEKTWGQKKKGIFIQVFLKIQAWHHIQRHLSHSPKETDEISEADEIWTVTNF